MLWRLFPDLRPRERERFLFFALLGGVITMAQTIGLAGSDALFLSKIGPQALPATFVLASAVTVTGSLGYALAVGRMRNDALFVVLLSGAGLVLLVGSAIAWTGATWILVAFFVGGYLTQGVLLYLHYWTFATDYFDTLASKRVFPLLVMSGSIGGILGGGLSVLLCALAPTETLIVTWAVSLLAGAILVRSARTDLRRWFAVESESDESSAEDMQAALRFVGRSPLARWLTISVVGMVLALLLMQFLEMQIFTEAFDSPEALASFFGIYLAVTNGIEIVVARVVTPALLRRFGIGTANLVHPVMTLLSFGALALDPRLYIGILARANRELMDNALASTVRSLSYNALPFRFRGRMRAFLEGIVFYAAMSAAGIALLLLEDRLEHRALCAVGMVAAGIYAYANLRVRREYLRSLVAEISSGRLDLDAVGASLGEQEVQQLAEQWSQSLSAESEPPRGWLDLPPLFARHGVTEPLRRSVSHPHPSVRVACIEALTGSDDPELPELLGVALSDPDPSVRLAAARAAGSCPQVPRLTSELRGRLTDPDARVRAEAALQLAAEGLQTLQQMVADEDRDAVIEALHRLPLALVEAARTRLDDDDAAIRASALATVRRLADGPSLTLERLEPNLGHADFRVRLAAAEALGERSDPSSAERLAELLDDGNREVRSAAAAGLASMGELGVRAAQRSVGSIRRWTAEAALLAVAQAGSASSRRVLESAFRASVQEAWVNLTALHLLQFADDVPSRFLQMALEDARSRSTWIAFRALEMLEEPRVVRCVLNALELESGRRRSNALEVLSNLGDREYAQQLALMLDDDPVADKLSAVSSNLNLPTRPGDALDRVRESTNRWLRLAAAGAAAANPATQEVHTMESLLALRRVPLFAHLSLEQLEAIGKFMTEEQYIAGEVVVREGQPGQELYVILEGEARAFKNYGTPDENRLTLMSPSGVVGYFGEIAIFDRAARSATVVITRDARLLTLAGARFMDLILQSPGISFEIFKVLTQRLRSAEERLRAQEDEERAPSEESAEG